MNTNLIAALIAAQGEIHALPKDSQNKQQGYAYTSAESLLSECRSALAKHGLTLIPTGQTMRYDDGNGIISRHFTLAHTSGETMDIGAVEFPVCQIVKIGDGSEVRIVRDWDKSAAASLTSSLGYFLRDLLLIPRTDEDIDKDHPESTRRETPAKRHDGPEPATEKQYAFLIRALSRSDIPGAVLSEVAGVLDTADVAVSPPYTITIDGETQRVEKAPSKEKASELIEKIKKALEPA